MSKPDCSACASRRSFLASSGVALAGLAAAPALASLQGCGDSSTIPTLSAPIIVPLSSLNISAAGSDSSFRDSSYPYNIIVRNNGNNQYQAWSSYCDHAGCEVEYLGTGFDCPCHGATWNAQGVLKNGPASSDLLEFKVTVSGGSLTLSNP